MPEFNREKTKSILLGDTGVAFDLAADINSAKAARGLYGNARAFAIDAIKCFLVGLDDDGVRVLAKAFEWLHQSIQSGEAARNFEEVSQKVNRDLLVIIRWLLEGASVASCSVDETNSLGTARECLAQGMPFEVLSPS